MLKIYLDDDLQNRPTPPSWRRFTTGESLISYLKTHPIIDRISLDNDLGLNRLEGYQVLDYMIEHQIVVHHINIHTANVVAKKHMLQAIDSAQRHQYLLNTKSITQYSSYIKGDKNYD